MGIYEVWVGVGGGEENEAIKKDTTTPTRSLWIEDSCYVYHQSFVENEGERTRH